MLNPWRREVNLEDPGDTEEGATTTLLMRMTLLTMETGLGLTDSLLPITLIREVMR